MKRYSAILFAVLVLQLMGLRGICTPPEPSQHDCCPAEENAPPTSSKLPECCVVTIVRLHDSAARATARTPTVMDSLDAAVPSSALLPVPWEAEGRRWFLAALPAPSPPISPLLQTCLLLI